MAGFRPSEPATVIAAMQASPPPLPPVGIHPPPFLPDAHGTLRVGGTRVTLETLLGKYALGDSIEGLHEGFPTVPLSELHAVVCYYLRNRPELDTWLAFKTAEWERIRADDEAAHGGAEWRRMILERRAALHARASH